jgi:hypothetical protein
MGRKMAKMNYKLHQVTNVFLEKIWVNSKGYLALDYGLIGGLCLFLG